MMYDTGAIHRGVQKNVSVKSQNGFDIGYLIFAVAYLLVFPISIPLTVYLIPTIVAYGNDKTNIAAIFVFNFLFGITFVGWGIALVWALVKD